MVDFALCPQLLHFMGIPVFDAESLLACLRLGRGEGEDDELGKLFFEMAVSLEQRGVLLDEATKRAASHSRCCVSASSTPG